MNLLDKDDFTEADINDLISNQVEESIHIEFKSAGALSKLDKPKAEISKDVSAFANSDGGLIFYGIIEANHVASSTDYINGNDFKKEWLEQVISSGIQQTIPSLRIFPVRFGNQISQTIYVVKIPRSDRSPHMCKDQRYYRRSNFESIPMEEYEIRNAYLRIIEGTIEYDSMLVRPDDSNREEDLLSFYIEFQFANNSNFTVDKYKLACKIDYSKAFHYNYDRHKEYDITRVYGEGFIISTTKTVPIFPSEILNALSFTVKFKNENFDEALSKVKIYLFTFSQNTTSENDCTQDFIELVRTVKDKHFDKNEFFI